MERECNQKNLVFLDILIENNQTGTYDFKVYRQNAITNVQIKLESSVDPKTTKGVFQEFVQEHGAYALILII